MVRRYRNRRKRAPRRYPNKRRSRKPRYAAKKRSYRRLMNATSRKYRDTYYGVPSSDDTSSTQAPLYTGTNVFAFCPTFRELDASLQNTRETKFVFAKGYRERITIRVSEPVLWRRIVLWTYEPFFGSVPFRVAEPVDTNQDYYLRRLDHKVLYGAQTQMRQQLFRGTSGVDYTNSSIHNAVIDRQKNRVVYDKTINVTPNYDASTDGFGKIMERTQWHPCNAKIMYDDIEEGSSVIRSGWSAVARRSAGNMYVIDIISTGDAGLDAATQVGTVAMHGTYYWHER
jgi:hypothetical protein